jgi:hypothetical protein
VDFAWLKLAQVGSALALLAMACGGNASDDPASPNGITGTGGAAGSGGMSGSGGSGLVGNCPQFPPRPRVTACRSFVGPGSPTFIEELVLNGPVVSTTSPTTAVGCHQIYDELGRDMAPPGSFELQLADDSGSVWSFSVYIPDFQNPLVNGEVVSVVSSMTPSSYTSPSSVNLTVRDANGALLFYVGDVNTPTSLTLPDGFALSLGDASCDGEDSCGSWSLYPFVIERAGASVEVPYFGSATLGDHRIVHAGAEMAHPGGIKCWDWSIGHLGVGITPFD